MNTLWTVWLVLVIVSFSGLEAYAIHADAVTLSQYIRASFHDYGAFGILLGGVIGGLLVHFW